MLATLCVFIVLIILSAKENAAIIGAIGASSFIAFTIPKAQVSRSKFLIGGYVVGIISGWVCYNLSLLQIFVNQPLISAHLPIIFSAIAIGLAIFLMVITNNEHPPAAGIALGLVLNGCTFKSVVVILFGIVVLCVLKKMLEPVLENLL